MPGLAELIHELAIANRILAHEGVLDAFGHVTVRHPDDPGRFIMARSRSPELVEPADFLEFTLDSVPVGKPTAQLFSERVIHGEIFKARPDVVAVCHHHASAILPFCLTGESLVPVIHLGASIGTDVPMWDQRDEFGDTNLLVVKAEEGASLARALGKHPLVLMWRHGATVVGATIQEVVFRSIYSCRNAELQREASRDGAMPLRGKLSPGEIERCGTIYSQPNVISRVWEYWVSRLERRGAMPPSPARARVTKTKPVAKKTRGAASAKRASSAKGRKAQGRKR